MGINLIDFITIPNVVSGGAIIISALSACFAKQQTKDFKKSVQIDILMKFRKERMQDFLDYDNFIHELKKEFYSQGPDNMYKAISHKIYLAFNECCKI